MPEIHLNNVYTAVGSVGYTHGSTTFPLAAGYGATLTAKLAAEGQPSISGSNPFRVTAFIDYNTYTVFRATSLSGDILTGAYAEGSSTQDYSAGTLVVGSLTAAQIRIILGESVSPIPESQVTGLVGDLLTLTTNVAANTSAVSANTSALALKAPLASPTFTDTPAAPTPATADNSTTLATTAFVKAQGYIAASTTTVLDFDGTTRNVNHGNFWPTAVNLGTGFYWDFVVMPRAGGSTYVLSDGYGGAHALLFGFIGSGGAGNLYRLSGQVYSGSVTTGFSGDDGLYYGEWGIIGVGWDGANIWTYVNGTPCSKTACATARQSPATGGGYLYIGGSDHANFNGRIAAFRAWDSAIPPGYTRPDLPLPVCWPLQPTAVSASVVPAEIMVEYTSPGRGVIPDLGAGRSNGTAVVTHPGWLSNTAGQGFMNDTGTPAARPPYVQDAAFPWQPNGTIVIPTAGVPTPSTPPGGCKVYDGFSRANRCFAFSNPGLGSTEGGSLGPLAWSTGAIDGGLTAFRWGILHGLAVSSEPNATRGVAWVNTGSATQDVRVDRVIGSSGCGYTTALAFRVVDRNNHGYVYTRGSSATNQTLHWHLQSAGVTANPDGSSYVNVALPASWTTLRVVANGTTVTAYVDNGSGGWTTVLALTGQTTNASGTGAGIHTGGDYNADCDGLSRWDNFTAY